MLSAVEASAESKLKSSHQPSWILSKILVGEDL